MHDESTGWPETLAALAGSLAQADVADDAIDAVLEVARPALMLDPIAVEEDTIPLGATKIGGHPDLPPDMPWPERTAYANAKEIAKEELDRAARFHAQVGIVAPWMTPEEGAAMIAEQARSLADTRAFLKNLGVDDDALPGDEYAGGYYTADEAARTARTAMAKAEAAATSFPLSFLAQLDLAALSQAAGFPPSLPRTGRLYVFYDLLLMPASFDPSSAPGVRVFHDDTPAAQLERCPLPAALAAVQGVEDIALPPAQVAIRSVVTTPADPAVAALDETEDGDGADEAYREWLSEAAGWPSGYQLGGWPREIQSGMAHTAQLAANGVYAGDQTGWNSAEAQRLLPDAEAWTLLLQVAEHEATGGLSAGSLNILLRAEHFADGRFDRVWAVYEDS